MARLLGLLLFGAAAIAAALGAVWVEAELTPRLLRETAPLAAVIGGLIGVGVFSRWPHSAAQAAVLGALSALVAIIFFIALYIFGEAVIVAVQGGAPGDAVAGAVGRLAERLPVAAPLGIVCFIAASLLMWMFGAVGRRFSR